jgi:hypothetical protein
VTIEHDGSVYRGHLKDEIQVLPWKFNDGDYTASNFFITKYQDVLVYYDKEYAYENGIPPPHMSISHLFDEEGKSSFTTNIYICPLIRDGYYSILIPVETRWDGVHVFDNPVAIVTTSTPIKAQKRYKSLDAMLKDLPPHTITYTDPDVKLPSWD